MVALLIPPSSLPAVCSVPSGIYFEIKWFCRCAVMVHEPSVHSIPLQVQNVSDGETGWTVEEAFMKLVSVSMHNVFCVCMCMF